jgi:hypothetical protein
MWYDRIHVYLQLIQLKEGKANKIGNIMRFARCMRAHRTTQGTIARRTKRRTATCTDQKIGSEKIGQGTAQGAPMRPSSWHSI